MPYPDLHEGESQEGDRKCENMRCGLQQAENSPQTILVLKAHDGIHMFLTDLCSFMLVGWPKRRWAKPACLPEVCLTQVAVAMFRQDMCLKLELCLPPLPLYTDAIPVATITGHHLHFFCPSPLSHRPCLFRCSRHISHRCNVPA